MSNVHFEGFNDTFGNGWEKDDVAIQGRRMRDGRINHFRQLTFADTPRARTFNWGKNNGRDRIVLDHDGSLTGEAGTVWSHKIRGGDAQLVEGLDVQVWANGGNDLPEWNDAIDGLLDFDFAP